MANDAVSEKTLSVSEVYSSIFSWEPKPDVYSELIRSMPRHTTFRPPRTEFLRSTSGVDRVSVVPPDNADMTAENLRAAVRLEGPLANKWVDAPHELLLEMAAYLEKLGFLK